MVTARHGLSEVGVCELRRAGESRVKSHPGFPEVNSGCEQ